MRASEVIREAKNVLFERGWNQNGYYCGDDGSLCIRAAVSVAESGHYLSAAYGTPAVQALQSVIDGPVSWWNDAPYRTFDDVIEVLDCAEKIAEQREAAS